MDPDPLSQRLAAVAIEKGLPLPEHVVRAILLCLVADSHLLLDVTSSQTAREHDKQQDGSVLANGLIQVRTSSRTPSSPQILGYIVGLPVRLLVLTPETTAAALAAHLLNTSLDPSEAVPSQRRFHHKHHRSDLSEGAGVGQAPVRGLSVVEQVWLLEGLELAPSATRDALAEMLTLGQVVHRGQTFPLPQPFMTIAMTQLKSVAPPTLELLDRFLLCHEIAEPLAPVPEAQPCTQPLYRPHDVMSLVRSAAGVFVSQDVRQFMRDIVVELRNNGAVLAGPSPRATKALLLGARVESLLSFLPRLRPGMAVTPTHLLSVARDVLAHRLMLHPQDLAEMEEEEGKPINSIRVAKDITMITLEGMRPPA